MATAITRKKPREATMTVRVLEKSLAESTLIKQFEAERSTAPLQRRAAAFARFAESGLPTRRFESWHYTDLRATMSDAAPLAPAPVSKAIETARVFLAARTRLGVARLVLLDGRFVQELSDKVPAGVTVAEKEWLEARADDPMVALNEAMSADAYELRIADDVVPAGSIEVVHVTTGEAARSIYSRFGISVGAGARVSLIETFLGGDAAAQRNVLAALNLGEGAAVTHVALIEDNAGLHVESQIVQLSAKAELNAFAFVAGGALTRRQIFLNLAGRDAKVSLGGLAAIDGRRRADTTLQVVHSAPAGVSREFYRAIVDDEGIGVFQGKIIVARAAQKTDGAMKSQAVLLSPSAQMNAKPELEIFADDVVCGHGATTGSLDAEQLFYLQTRGIERGEAEAMLLEAFGREAIDRVEDPTLIEVLSASFRRWLDSREARSASRAPDAGREARL